MSRQKLIEELRHKKKQNELMREVKKRLFVKKYFDYDKLAGTDIYSDLSIEEESFNEIYLKTFNNPQRINIYYGGAGSGKSEFIARKLALKFLLEKGHNGLFVRKFAVDVRKSIFALLAKVLNEYLPNSRDKYVKINKSDMTFTFYNGNQILMSGLDDNEKIKSITFENGVLTDIHIEEANQCIGTEIKELNRRLRGVSGVKKEINISFNPVSKASWLYIKYFNLQLEKEKYYTDERKMILKTTVYDNKYATEEDIRELEAETDIYDREVYLNGNFGVISDNDCIVSFSDAMHCTDLELEDTGEIYIGIDCAGMGDDSTVAMVRKGAKQLDRGFELHKAEEKTVVDNVIMLIQELQEEYQIEGEKKPHITLNIDTTGVGFGVGSQLRTAGLEEVTVNSISFGGKASDSDRYFNTVTEMYFNIRNLAIKRDIQLLEDTETINELCSRKFVIEEAKSRRRIESKDKFKKRLKKSPDKADALVLAFYVPNIIEPKITTIDYQDDILDSYYDF